MCLQSDTGGADGVQVCAAQVVHGAHSSIMIDETDYGNFSDAPAPLRNSCERWHPRPQLFAVN